MLYYYYIGFFLEEQTHSTHTMGKNPIFFKRCSLFFRRTHTLNAKNESGLEGALVHQSQVSALGLVGYGPTMLLLRHSHSGHFVYQIKIIFVRLNKPTIDYSNQEHSYYYKWLKNRFNCTSRSKYCLLVQSTFWGQK